MATPEELKNERELNRLKREGNQAQRNSISLAAQLAEQARGLTDSFNELAGALADAGTAQDSAFGRGLRAGRKMRDITQELVSEVQGYTELSLKELKTKQKQFKVQRGILELTRPALERELKLLQDKEKRGEKLNGIEEDRLKKLQDITNVTDEAFDSITAQLEGRIKQEKKINGLMGIGGGLLKGASGLMSKLGIHSNAFSDSIEEATERMEETARTVEANNKLFGRTRTLFSGLVGLAKAFRELIKDPLVTIGLTVRASRAAVQAFLELNAKAVEFGRLTGRNLELEAALNDQRITAVEYVEAAVAATNELGLSASGVFGPSQIAQIGEAVQLLGLSAEQATNLALRSEAVGMSLNSYQDGLLEGINAANKFTESAVAPGIALRDIADVSEDIALSLQNNPVLLGKAAVQARALGLSLKKVDDIAGGLLDFESSIEAELEAQLLTGRALNLSKAREFALMNDIEGVAREIANQGITAADFAGMNRLAQESLAQALGMSRQELAKTLQIQSMSVEEQEEANRLAMAQQSLQDQIRRAVNALQLAFAPIVEAILPHLVNFIDKAAGKVEKFFESVFNGKGVFESLKEAFPSTAAIIDPLRKAFNWLQDKLQIIQDKMKDPESGLSEGLKAAFPALGPLITIGEVLGKIVGYLGESPKALTAALLVFGTTKLTGINLLGETLKGVGKLGKKGLGQLGGIFKKTEEIGSSSGSNIKSSFKDTVTSTFKTVKNVATELAKTLKNVATEVSKAISSVLTNVSKGIGTALTNISKGIGTALTNISKGIGTALANVSKGIGSLLTNIGSGLGKGIGGLIKGIASGLASLANPAALIGLGAITLAIIGFATALRIAGPALEPLGKMLKSTFEGIAEIVSSVFTGVGEVIGKIGETIAKFQEARTAAKTAKIEAATAAVKELAGIDEGRFNAISAGIRNIATALTEFSNAISGGLIFGGIDVKEQNAQVDIFSRISNLNSEGLTAAGTGLNNFLQAISNASLGTLNIEKLKSFIDQFRELSKLKEPTRLINGINSIGTLVPTMNIATNALNSMAVAVMSLASALKAVTTDDIKKIQDLVEAGFESDTRSTFEIIAEPVNKLAKVLGGGEEGDAADIVAKLDELIKVVRDGGNVYMDMRDVGETGQLRYGSFS